MHTCFQSNFKHLCVAQYECMSSIFIHKDQFMTLDRRHTKYSLSFKKVKLIIMKENKKS